MAEPSVGLIREPLSSPGDRRRTRWRLIGMEPLDSLPRDNEDEDQEQ